MMIVVVMDHPVRHVRLSHFLHGHFLTLSEGRDNEAERSDSCQYNSKFVHRFFPLANKKTTKASTKK
jgi:hypothetical protein